MRAMRTCESVPAMQGLQGVHVLEVRSCREGYRHPALRPDPLTDFAFALHESGGQLRGGPLVDERASPVRAGLNAPVRADVFGARHGNVGVGCGAEQALDEVAWQAGG